MNVANIVSETYFELPKGFKLVNDFNEIDSSLPTLIVGYNLASKIFHNLDVTSKRISDSVFWCYKKTENRDDFTQNLDRFIYSVYRKLFKSVNYIFIDLIQYKTKTLIKIVRKLLSSGPSISYKHKDMIYIYQKDFIFGVDLNQVQFVGIDKEKILNKIKSISTEFIDEYDNIDGLVSINIKYVPLLYTIENT